MKKILLACDGKDFPKGAFEFAKDLHQQEPILLTGAFLHVLNFDELLPVSFAITGGPIASFLEEEKEAYKKNTEMFETLCVKEGIEFRLHEESQSWNIEDFAKESRFSDLVMMSEELFCSVINSSEPNGFMQQVIHRSECPVMLFPEKYKPFKKIVIAYDGKQDSMYALKQFIQLFPQYSEMETKIVYIKDETSDDIPDLEYLEEYAARHFSNLDIEKLHFNGRKYFETWISGQGDILVVAGSYSRGGFANSLKKSFSEDIIQNHRVPVFAAHR
jgi:nucleotide-binding universal stress UspA family protein